MLNHIEIENNITVVWKRENKYNIYYKKVLLFDGKEFIVDIETKIAKIKINFIYYNFSLLSFFGYGFYTKCNKTLMLDFSIKNNIYRIYHISTINSNMQVFCVKNILTIFDYNQRKVYIKKFIFKINNISICDDDVYVELYKYSILYDFRKNVIKKRVFFKNYQFAYLNHYIQISDIDNSLKIFNLKHQCILELNNAFYYAISDLHNGRLLTIMKYDVNELYDQIIFDFFTNKLYDKKNQILWNNNILVLNKCFDKYIFRKRLYHIEYV